MKMRSRRIRTFGVILFLAQGVPMFVAGDEFGRTQRGNNNAYCQDNLTSWLDWKLAETNNDLLRFFQKLITLRKQHEVFRRSDFFPGPQNGSVSDITWQSTQQGREDWSSSTKTLAYFLNGGLVGPPRDDDFFIMLNGDREDSADFEVPVLPRGRIWRRILDTAAAAPDDIMDEPQGVILTKGKPVLVLPMAAVVLISKPTGKSKG